MGVPGSRWGGDNPDNVYRIIPIDDKARYRLEFTLPEDWIGKPLHLLQDVGREHDRPAFLRHRPEHVHQLEPLARVRAPYLRAFVRIILAAELVTAENAASYYFPDEPYAGADFPWLAANVVKKDDVIVVRYDDGSQNVPLNPDTTALKDANAGKGLCGASKGKTVKSCALMTRGT